VVASVFDVEGLWEGFKDGASRLLTISTTHHKFSLLRRSSWLVLRVTSFLGLHVSSVSKAIGPDIVPTRSFVARGRAPQDLLVGW
jgi:hypothetical protein